MIARRALVLAAAELRRSQLAAAELRRSLEAGDTFEVVAAIEALTALRAPR